MTTTLRVGSPAIFDISVTRGMIPGRSGGGTSLVRRTGKPPGNEVNGVRWSPGPDPVATAWPLGTCSEARFSHAGPDAFDARYRANHGERAGPAELRANASASPSPLSPISDRRRVPHTHQTRHSSVRASVSPSMFPCGSRFCNPRPTRARRSIRRMPSHRAHGPARCARRPASIPARRRRRSPG